LFTGAGMGCTFLAPTVLALYWRRATRAGALTGLVSGFVCILVLYVLGWCGIGKPTQAERVAIAVTPLASSDPFQAVLLTQASAKLSKLSPDKEGFAPVYLFNLD